MIWDSLTEIEQQELRETQESFEDDMLAGGIARYWKEYQRAPDEGLPEQQLLDSVVIHLAPYYQEWIDSVCSNERMPDWVTPLLAIGPAKMADLTVRCLMREWLKSSMFGEQFIGYMNEAYPLPTAQRLANAISEEVLAIIAYQQSKEAFKDDWKRQSKFIKSWTPKRCRAFSKKVGGVLELSLKKRQDFGHHMVRIAEKSGVIITLEQRHRSGRIWNRKLFVSFNPEILEEIHKKHKFLESCSLLYRPMVVPPVPHTMERSGGYLFPFARKEMVQKYSSNYDENFVKPQHYSTPSTKVITGLNAMMETEWAVNTKVLDVMTNLFEGNTRLANLPAQSFDAFDYSHPYPEKGTKEEKAKWCSAREEMWGSWFKEEQARARMLVRLTLAKKLSKFKAFWHTWTCDFRGRGYTVCELLSPQGSDFDKALAYFAEARTQTERGLYWLKVHVANLFDYDKVSFDERVQWVDENMQMFERINQDPYENLEWVSDKVKKNPSFQRLAAVFDLCRKDGLTQVPVQMDGACNGSQHWSAIMRDETIGLLTNVLPSNEPQDLYQYIADKTTEYCKDKSEEVDWYGEFLEYWNNSIERGVTKRPTMCDSYGLTFYGIQKYVKLEGHLDWIPKEKQGGAITELARAIQAGLAQSLILPNEGKEYLKTVSEIASNLDKDIVYTVPSGFKVVHSYAKPVKRRSFAALFNSKELMFSTHSSNEVDLKAVSQAISPNWIHSLDASHLFCTVYRAIEEGITQFSLVHDSYGCPAPDVDTLRRLTREEFYAMHKENQLQRFREDVEKHLGLSLPELPRRGNLDIERVLESDYLFA